jgi:four helix bundle protein
VERRKDKGESLRNKSEIMVNEDLKIRTKNFAVRIIKLFAALPKTTEAQVLGKQILRCGTSVGAQYREAQHAKSDADFISKIEGSLQELEETAYWLELIEELSLFNSEKLQSFRQETKELTAIFVTIAKKVKERRN